jgi:glyoxylase-like metal-dependent hydrolase (beta-lactamase superfamily II)
MPDLIEYGNGHWAYDSGYYAQGVASQHLICDGGRVAFIDAATQFQLPRALLALERLGLGPEAVDWVILTHIHLDHAGGAGAMIERFPHARLVVHPRGAPHMEDPTRLMAAAIAVYGDAETFRMYGNLIPVPPDRILQATDGMLIRLGQRDLVSLDAPGHARHHLVVHDPAAAVVFTGDVFGVSYRGTDVGGRPFLMPSTSPSQFDPKAMADTINRIVALDPKAVGLAHFGQLANPKRLAEDLLTRLDAMVEIAHRLGADVPAITQAVQQYFLAQMRAHGSDLPESAVLDLWQLDLKVSSLGLAAWKEAQASA